MTVGELRKLIAGLPDDAPVMPDWAEGCIPNDYEPGVEIFGAERGVGRLGGDAPHLSVLVKLFYLDEVESDEEDDE